MQQKKGAFPKENAALASAEQAVEPNQPTDPKPKRGRPKTSPHDPKTQGLLRVRNHRAKLKAAGLEKVETFLPSTWHEYLQSIGKPLQELGVEAFALLLRKRGKGALVEAIQPPSKTIDASAGR
jgi:hypothetical protein